MSTTAVAATKLTLNTPAALIPGTTGTAIVHANTHVITPAGPLGKLIIWATNTTAAEKVVTILAGDNPPANATGIGNVTMTLGAGDSTATNNFVVLEGARFLQDDGTVHITVAGDMTGRIVAYQLPAGA